MEKDPTFSTCSQFWISLYIHVYRWFMLQQNICPFISVLLYDPACSASAHRKRPLHGSQRQCVNPCLSHGLPIFVIDSQLYDRNQRQLSPSRLTQWHKQNPGQTEHHSIILYDKLLCCCNDCRDNTVHQVQMWN